MLDCLYNYVGLRGCGIVPPASGHYINTLPGISLKGIELIADSEQITYAGVWSDVQTEAGARFYVDFINELTKCYQMTPYCDYEEIICANVIKLTVAWKYLLGNQLMLERLYSDRINYLTTVALQDAEKLRDHYQVEYEKALAQAARLVDVSSCCLDCGGNPEYVTWLP